MIVKKHLKETVHSSLLLGCFYLWYMLYSKLSRVLLLVLSCLLCNCCWLIVCIVVVVFAFFFTLYARLLARSQYPEGPATGHLDTGFSWFPCA